MSSVYGRFEGSRMTLEATKTQLRFPQGSPGKRPPAPGMLTQG
jgi:hypothetical protein